MDQLTALGPRATNSNDVSARSGPATGTDPRRARAGPCAISSSTCSSGARMAALLVEGGTARPKPRHCSSRSDVPRRRRWPSSRRGPTSRRPAFAGAGAMDASPRTRRVTSPAPCCSVSGSATTPRARLGPRPRHRGRRDAARGARGPRVGRHPAPRPDHRGAAASARGRVARSPSSPRSSCACSTPWAGVPRARRVCERRQPSSENGPRPIWSRTLTTAGLVNERRCQFAPSTTSV